MKQPIITHAAWLLVAAGTFAAGRYMMPDTPDVTASSDETAKARLLSPTENPGKSSSAGAAGGNDGASATGGSTRFNVLSAMDAFKTETDPLKKNLLFAELLMNMTAENAADVFAMLQENGTRGPEGGRQMGLFFQAWGKLDGKSAVEAAMTMNEEGGRRGPGGGGFYAAAAISSWAKADQAGAEEWLNSQEDGREKGMLTMGYVNGLAEADPDAATSFVLAMVDSENAEGEGGDRRGWDMNRRLYDTIARQQLERGLDVAKDWADSLPDGSFKADALDEIAERLVREDINGAKDWITKYADQEFARDAVGEIAERLSQDDPKSAVDWVLSLPEASQGRALYSAFNEWTEADVTAASDYLSKMPDSPAKDSAVYGLVRELDNEDAASAAAWAVTIQDEQTRTRAIMEVSGNYYRQDQAAATTFMQQNGVSQEMQQMIINRSQRGGPGGFDRGRGGRGGPGGR